MVFNDQYLKNEKDLLKNYIHDYYYPSDKDNPLWVRASPTELVIRPECNQNCSYCYITQHGKELYPLEKRVDTETTLKHIDAFLKYIFDNKLFVRRWELFAGDLFYDHLIYKIFDLFYKYYAPVADELFEQFHDIVEIVTPTNGFFFQYEEHQKKLEEYTDRFEKIHVILGFSLSTDGLYAVDSREKSKDADQAYFDKIFTFTSKMMYGYHPMISPENVHNACKNIDWWVEMYEKHNLDKSPNHRHPYPAMLEVRNDYWTDEQLKDYSTYLKHLWDICLKLNKDSFKNMARYLFVGDGKDGSLPSSGDYDPLKIMYMDEKDSRHLLGCTMQELIRINVADLSLCTCHRLTYPQFTGGKYILNENNEIVDLEPQAVTAWISLRAGSPAYYPKCENCEYNPVCMKGCLGSQYEYSGEIYYPIPKVCELEKTKINTMLELYYNGGIIATAIRENMIQRDSEMANYLIKLSEMRGYKIEL